MEQIKGIAFDLDGTLVDAAPWHQKAFNRAIFYYGVPEISQEEHLRIYNGLSTKRKLEILTSKGLVSQCYHEPISKLKQMYTEELIEKNCRPVDHVIKTVEWCKERFPIILVTNCSEVTTRKMLLLSGIADSFGGNIISSACTYGYIKPHPMPYKIAQTVLGLKPKELLSIEDTDKGVISAVEAGCRVWKIPSHSELTVLNLESVLADYERASSE